MPVRRKRRSHARLRILLLLLLFATLTWFSFQAASNLQEYEEVRNFTDAKGNQPHLTKSYLELEELLAEDFRTYMKDENVKKDSPKRNSIFRQIVNFLKTLFGLRTAALAKDVSATKEFKDAHTKAWNLTINNRLNAINSLLCTL